MSTYACIGNATLLVQVTLSRKYSRDYFNRHGDLQHIRRLRCWLLDNVLLEKYDFAEKVFILLKDNVLLKKFDFIGLC